ncbi:MAG: hypothetical protein A3J79_08655 [Elusimicrobia bacterium RIFOXYB2_FULL_62_6]|nr:MAG: hypothetical protein A3J79_08655 [Elusimicrobia bacterium RIFOXYB2_FULL_62_6]
MRLVRPRGGNRGTGKEEHMLWTISVVLVILWVLGLLSGHTLGNYIHILLVIAVVTVLVRVIRGEKILK